MPTEPTSSTSSLAALAVKDHYTFDFLELAEEHSERQLQQALVANLRQFLTELGGAFAFIVGTISAA